MIFKPAKKLVNWLRRLTRHHEDIPKVQVETVKPRDFYEQAISCLERRDISGAISKLQIAIARFPNYCPGYVCLAELLEREGNLLEAENIVTEGLQRNLNNSQRCKLQLTRGVVRIQQDDLLGGVSDLQAAIELIDRKNRFDYFYEAAYSLTRLQKFDRATELLLEEKSYLSLNLNSLTFLRTLNLIEEQGQIWNSDLKRVRDNPELRVQKFQEQLIRELAVCDGSLFPPSKYSEIPIRYEFPVKHPIPLPLQLDDLHGLIQKEREVLLGEMKRYVEQTQSILTLPDAILGTVGDHQQFIISQQGFYYKRDRRPGINVAGYAVVSPVIQTIETGYFLALAATENYYHQVLDVVSSLVQYPLQQLNCPLFIFAEQLELTRRLVEGAGIDRERVQPISPEMGIVVKTGFVPTAERSLDHRVGVMGRKIGENILRKSGVQPRHNAERIYISRRRSSQRPLQNEVAVEAMLQELGFQIVFMEDESLEHQIAIVRGAKVVVAPHGAGLINVLFAPAGMVVIELVPESYPHPAFCKLAHFCGHLYYPLFGEMKEVADLSAEENFHWWVDCDRLRELLHRVPGI
ncbi:MAG: glycosyltransferase family 61 protein [Oscillatoriales cyanobacterium]|nr:MAG: glycosyltransferase family 61 protein [Oscillatoriales cyanobacterium]